MTGATTVPMLGSQQCQPKPSQSTERIIPNSPIESLREIDPNLRILRRSANRDIRVRRSLQTAQAIANNENGGAEASERAIQDTRPRHERSDAVQAETPDESRFVAVVAQDPVGVAEGGERVCAEVGGLETGGAGAGDVETVLEVFV